jgi:hypothetical protein
VEKVFRKTRIDSKLTNISSKLLANLWFLAIIERTNFKVDKKISLMNFGTKVDQKIR